MFHGLENKLLYSAYHLVCTFVGNGAQKIECTGTGFFLVSNDSEVFLVTNRHMVDIGFANPACRGFQLSELRISGKGNDDESGLPDIDQEWNVTDTTIRLSQVQENDIACLVNPKVFSVSHAANASVQFSLPQDLLATKEDFETKFSVCDFLAFPGYPEWHDRRQRRPILRTGTISSDPRYDYSWSSEYEGECIAYEAFSYGGSSGSPVFAVQKGPRPDRTISFPGFRELKLIGINAGHLNAGKNGHSGISYMYKASAILDIIENA